MHDWRVWQHCIVAAGCRFESMHGKDVGKDALLVTLDLVNDQGIKIQTTCINSFSGPTDALCISLSRFAFHELVSIM